MEKFKELLKAKGVSDETIAQVLEEMENQKIYTTSEENIDVRYQKLKGDHDALAKQYQEANTLIESLKKNGTDNAELQKKIGDYENTVNDLKAQLEKANLDNAIKVALLENKATDVDYLTFKLREKGELKLDENGKLKDADMVQKVTIIPRGDAGGYNLMTPREEKYFHRKREYMAQITGLLGGRVAEELVFGEISAGAVNDIEKITKIAKAMVRVFGMSSLGPIQYADPQGNVFLGRDYNNGNNYSAGVAAEIDKEVRKIVDECYEDCKRILSENRDLLDLIANTLFEEETLTKEQIQNLVQYGTMTSPQEEAAKAAQEAEAEAAAEAETETKADDAEGSAKDEEAPKADDNEPQQDVTDEEMEAALKELTKR